MLHAPPQRHGSHEYPRDSVCSTGRPPDKGNACVRAEATLPERVGQHHDLGRTGLIVVELTVRLGYAVFTYATLAFLGIVGTEGVIDIEDTHRDVILASEIAQGKNPYADLITLSKGNDWKVQMGIGGNDAVTAKDSVETSNGDNGVPWIGGQAGGAGQPLLQFTGDIVKAGYNINMNRPVTAVSPVPPDASTHLPSRL